MSSTIVRCSDPRCREVARYKIAAAWSLGSFSELKTFAYACSQHLGILFREAEGRRFDYPLAEGEEVDDVGIFKIEPGRRDRRLHREWKIEESYRDDG